MISRLVSWCARHHWFVFVTMLLLAVAGDLARRRLTGDVIPDLADPQIGIVADWMGHPAPAVESTVTKPIADALAGLPGAKAIRGLTMSRMAYANVVFDSADGLDDARKEIVRRLKSAKLPDAVRLYIGPPVSATGWVFEYALTDPKLISSQYEMRRFQDEVLRPALSTIPGVAEVVSVGGDPRDLRVEVRAHELRERGLAFTDVVDSLRPIFDKASGVTKLSPQEMEGLVVQGDGHRAPLGQVALVRFNSDEPTGLADLNGKPAVGGIIVARRDANIAALVGEAKAIIARESAKLPHRDADPERGALGAATDVRITTTYDRAELATAVRSTLLRALSEEVLVVVLVILIFLLHGRSALVPLITLPVVLLLTFAAMWLLRVPATIMSFGGIGIALGLAVDADIVALEASHRRLETMDPKASRKECGARILAAAQSFAPAILTSLIITAISFLPVFAFSGETGRLLRPLALTKTLVIAAAALVTLTLAPALRERLLRGRVIPEFSNPITRNLVRAYRPFVHFALRRPVFTLATAGLALISCLPILSRLGAEFLPRIDEGDLFYMPTTLPGVSSEEAALQLSWQDHAMRRFGEVASVFGKVGRAETGTDPAPYSMAETTIRLRPRHEWPTIPRARWYSSWAPEPVKKVLRRLWPDRVPRTTATLVEELDKAVRLPGWTAAWTGPARARMDMMATGVRVPVGIRVISPDAQRLDALGTELRALIERIPGTRSAVFESLGGETWIDFQADGAALTKHQVAREVARSTVDLIASGGQIGEIEHDGRRLRVRVSPQISEVTERGPLDVLREVTVRSLPTVPIWANNGALVAPPPLSTQPVPLALVGKPTYTRQPAALRTERGELCAYVHVDLAAGTDIQSYVTRARQEVDKALATGVVQIGPNERIEWTGQYDLLLAGQRRLMWIVPIVALLMLGLLFLQFRSFSEAFLVLVSVPFALVGSFWTLYLLGYPLSAPVWVGLLSVVGLAMQTGVVMVVYIDAAFHQRIREGRINSRDDIIEAHAEGTIRRLRPKIMTITTMAAALLPLLWFEGAGSEIMRRVAAPMIGGLATSAFLTLEVLPVLYTIWRTRQLRKAQRLGLPVASVVGEAPTWART